MRVTLPGGACLTVEASMGHVTFDRGALELRGTFPVTGEGEGMELRIDHPFRSLAHVWIPHLTPEADSVAGDAVFRCPAVILSRRGLALALVADVDDVKALRGVRAYLDYDHPRRRVTFGAGAYRAEGHVFFRREPTVYSGQEVRLRIHVLASRRSADIENPHGMVASWVWKRWGHAGMAPPPSIPEAMKTIARWAFSSEGWGEIVWQSLDLGGQPAGAPVFIVDVSQHPSIPPAERRYREARSIWNQAWFSTQRCANGLLRYARRIGSPDLERRARLMTRVALGAPQKNGLYPSVLRAGKSGDWDDAEWTNSDRRPKTVSGDACHIVDAAFTGRMLVEWYELTTEMAAIERAQRFADRLVALQLPSGAFPGWIEPDGSIAAELRESAETAVGTTLLLTLPVTRKYREAAERALRFLKTVIDDGRWEDFETYYSCAPWGDPEMMGKRVSRNGVYKQNTLSIAWCAEAMLAAAAAGIAPRRSLRLARRCIDDLSLYQAVWDPAFLPARAHGGFGVMNADSEWNDARQSLFAPLYFELYRHQPDRELLERGLSALAASFSMLYRPEDPVLTRAYERRFPFFGPESYGFMMENQGHGTGDPIGTFAIFTWGNGSALAAAATIRDRYGYLPGVRELTE